MQLSISVESASPTGGVIGEELGAQKETQAPTQTKTLLNKESHRKVAFFMGESYSAFGRNFLRLT